jgi:hypothetical protein
MNPMTVFIGVAATGYGIYTAWARQAKPEQFKKLGPMKEAWGEKGGFMLHVVGYTVMPIIVGLGLIMKGMQGGSFF